MKLFSIPSELKVLRSICEAKESISGLLLASVVDQTFHYNPCLVAYRRLLYIVRKDGNIPDYMEICSDPAIEEDARKILLKNDQAVIESKSKALSVLKVLEKYRQLRGLVQLFEDGFKSLDNDKVDVDKIIDETADRLSYVRSRMDAKKALIHIGKGNNSAGHVKKILRGKKAPLIPTGYRGFDDRNGGISLGSLWIIGGTTGGGKSTLALDICLNTTMIASEDAALVSLEMTDDETVARYLANRTGIELGKFVQYKLAKGERKLVKQKYKEHVEKLKGQDTRFTIYSPDEDVSIEETLLLLKPYGYKVIIIDYISLLKGADGEDMWRQLGKIARFAKIYAKINKIIVVLLCQINDEGAIRYSKAISEHSNNAWFFVMNEESRESGIIEIKQPKARNQDPTPFSLKIDFARMRVSDVDAEDTMENVKDKDSKGEDDLEESVDEL